MEEIKYKEVRRGRGRRSPGDRRVSSAGYNGPERRSGKDRRLATGIATAVVAGSLLVGAAEEASAEIHGRRLSDKLHAQETVLPKRQHGMLNLPAEIKKFTPAHIRAVPSTTGEAANKTAPKALKTAYSTIYYDNADQLYAFSEMIELKRRTTEEGEPNAAEGGGRIKGLFGSIKSLFKSSKTEADLVMPIARRLRSTELTTRGVDELVVRVSTILHLDPPEFHVSVYLYDGYEELTKAYKELGHTGKAPRAFYSRKSRAVYLPVDGLTDELFAVEIAHAVINASFSEQLPHQLTEVLAHHVYVNL